MLQSAFAEFLVVLLNSPATAAATAQAATAQAATAQAATALAAIYCSCIN